MKRIKRLTLVTVIVISCLAMGCSNSKQNDDVQKSQQKNYKNLNLTILIDLSDRISQKKNPGQVKNDLKLISNIIEIFKIHLAEKGVVNSEDKIKVIYYPEIGNDALNSVIDSLNIDFTKMSFVERKRIFSQLSKRFNENLIKVYEFASMMSEYPGSDLFNYFKHRLIDDCVIDDSNFVNLLVILTDGYIFHKDAMYRVGNRFSYLAPKSYQVQMFRNRSDWEKIFDQQDYGLINTNLDLSRLNIIAAQFNPIPQSPKDFDILNKYWSKWFEEQKLKSNNYKILRNDNPVLNIPIIENFIRRILNG